VVVEFQNAVVADVAVVATRRLENVASGAELKFKNVRRVSFQYLRIDYSCFAVLHVHFGVLLGKPTFFSDGPRAARDNSWVSARRFDQEDAGCHL